MPRRAKAVYTKAIDKKGDYEIYSTKSKQLLGKIKGVNHNHNSYWEALDTDGNCMFNGGRKKECMDYFCDLEEKRLMAKGGNVGERIIVVLDEGNGKVINDLYTQWNNIKTDQDHENWNEKVRNTTFGSYGTVSMNEVLDKFDFDNSSLNEVAKRDFKNEISNALRYGNGGGIGFEKLSNQVAKEYEGDKVAPKYQHEYGKTYSREEAQEVGDKVAGKVYWQQQGRKFADGGNMENLDARISKAIYKAYGNIDDAIEFKEYNTGHGISPYQLVYLAVRKGFITPEEINKDVLNSAYETSSETEEEEEIGSSDTNHYVWSMLRDSGFDMKIANGSYVRANGKMSTGGEVDDDDCGCDDDEYATGGSIESTRLKYAKKDIALVMKQGFMSIFGTKHGLLNLSYEDGVFTISDNKFNPRTESYNVLFEGDKKGAIDFVANSYVVEGFAYGGSMSSSPKTYYIILNDGSKKEFQVKHPKEINGIYFAMGYDRGTDSIAKGTPMVHFENALNPLYNADGTPAEAMPQYAGKDYNDLKGQMAEGGNIYSKEESIQIAKTILSQLGGQNKLVAFTGAYNFVVGDGAVMFRIKNRGVNFVKVKLNGSDLYDVTFGRISGTNYKIVEELDDVYAEDLIDIFEKETGMYLRFDKGGNLSPSDSDSYYRWRMKKFGFKPYGKEKGRFKITYVAEGEPQEEITTTKEMAIDAANRYTKLYQDVKIFDESGSEIKYAKGGGVYVHKYNPNITLEFIENTSKGIKGLQKNPKSLSRKEKKEGIIVNYSDSEIKDLFDKQMATGGNLHSSEFYEDGGEVNFSLKNDTKYVRSEDIQEVRLTNGKKIFNYEKWYGSQRNYGESVDNIFSGLYIANRPFESKEQYKMFKDGGNLPASAKYIKRSEIESIIIEDENGEEKEIPANRIVNGIWYDNQRNEALIERAKKEGLLKK